MQIHPLWRGFVTLTAMNKSEKSCFVVGMCEGPMVKNSRSLKQKANLPKHLLPEKRSTFVMNHAAFIANNTNE